MRRQMWAKQHWFIAVLVAVVIGALPAPARAADPLFIEAKGADNFKVLFIEKTDAPPVLDGRLDDACWKGTESNADFGPCAYGARRFPTAKTEFRYRWDDKYLYLAFTCHEDSAENMARVRAADMDKSKLIYIRDCIELHIDGNNDNATRFQVWFNPAAEKMIFWHYDFGWGILVNENYGLSANWDYAVGLEKQSWTVEGRIALNHIQIKPKAGTLFGMNPARFRFNKQGERDDGVKKDKVTQFLSWSTQGGDHHNVGQFGKCILVNKKPANLRAGLALAFPDLNERTIMIQTPKGFTVFDKGKAKAVEELTAVEAAARQTATFINDPAIKNPYMRKPFTEAEAKLKAIRAETAALKVISAATLSSIRARLGALRTTIDRTFWVSKRQLLLAGKLTWTAPTAPQPRARALPEEPDNGPDPDTRITRYVPWGKGYGRQKIKALIVAAEGAAWNAFALKRRLDLEADIYYATGGVSRTLGPTSDYYKEGIQLLPEKARRLKALLANPYDVIVPQRHPHHQLPILPLELPRAARPPLGEGRQDHPLHALEADDPGPAGQLRHRSPRLSHRHHGPSHGAADRQPGSPDHRRCGLLRLLPTRDTGLLLLQQPHPGQQAGQR
ncbi:MAG: sugar-binding protein [Planctomycetota bacterium]|jgi:hypothetical protein